MPSKRIAANRLARHFESLLSGLNTMYRQGGALSEAALLLLDVELPFILKTRREVEILVPVDRDAAITCAAFARDGAALIHLRLHPRERIRWIKAGIQAADWGRDSAFKARLWNDLGLGYAALGELDDAKQCYRQALELTKDTEEGSLVAALGNLANVYLCTNKPDEAIELLHQVAEAARARENYRAVADALNNIGAAYKDKSDYVRSIDFHEQSLTLHRKIEDRRGEGSALVNLGVSCRKSGQPLKAIEYYEQALHALRSIRDERGESDALWNMALALFEMGRVQHATECARDAFAIRERLEDPRAEKIRKRLRDWGADTNN